MLNCNGCTNLTWTFTGSLSEPATATINRITGYRCRAGALPTDNEPLENADRDRCCEKYDSRAMACRNVPQLGKLIICPSCGNWATVGERFGGGSGLGVDCSC